MLQKEGMSDIPWFWKQDHIFQGSELMSPVAGFKKFRRKITRCMVRLEGYRFRIWKDGHQFQCSEGRSHDRGFGRKATRPRVRKATRTRVRMENHMLTCSERRPSLTRVRMEDPTAQVFRKKDTRISSLQFN